MAREQPTAVPRSGIGTSSPVNFLYEHVALSLMTAIACLAGVIWMVAIATDYWIISISSAIQPLIYSEQNLPQNADIFLWSYSGLWRRCDIFYQLHSLQNTSLRLNNETVLDQTNHVRRCDFHQLSKNSQTNEDSAEDSHPSDFIQAELSVVILIIIIMSLAIGFSVYALRHPRYMYKRVAAALHAFTAVTIFVIIELVKSRGHPGYTETGNKLEINNGLSKEAIQVQNYHGYSFLLAWTVLIMFAATGLAFICMSGKRKNLSQDSDIVLK